MSHLNSPPPPENNVVGGVTAENAGGEEARAKLPWHKPTVHVLTEIVNTSGGPTQKRRGPGHYESEGHPDPYQVNKNYVPRTW